MTSFMPTTSFSTTTSSSATPPTADTSQSEPDSAPSCPTAAWTTADVSQGELVGDGVPLATVTVYADACADTVQIEPVEHGAEFGYQVGYTAEVLSQGRGDPLPLAGDAQLAVTIGLPAYDIDAGTLVLDMASETDMVSVSGLDAVQQIGFGGSFEGQTTIGIGVDHERPFTAGTSPTGALVIRIAAS